MIFLGKKFQLELVWTVRCKSCGECYVMPEIKAGEVTCVPDHQVIRCYKTHIPHEYSAREFETLWAPLKSKSAERNRRLSPLGRFYLDCSSDLHQSRVP